MIVSGCEQLIYSMYPCSQLARNAFTRLYTDSREQLSKEVAKIGPSVQKAMPYYECRLKAKGVRAVVA